MSEETLPAAIRAATPNDAVEIARLLTILGHPTTAGEVAERWCGWSAAGDLALVADRGGSLAGLATLHRMVVLHRPRPVGRITALVVDPDLRGRGVGHALVVAAEAALAVAGCGLMEVTSNVRLTEAHEFYERIGYQRTSARFSKTLAGSPDAALGTSTLSAHIPIEP